MKVTEQPAYKHLRSRKQAYGHCFPKDQIFTAIVLADLGKFCRLLAPPIGATDAETNRLIGRQEVIHRIIEHLKLDLDDLFSLYAKLPADVRQALFDPSHQLSYDDEP